jgi:peptidoglycan L-alanyl-D-glutamate endopeptidase CwlK
MTDHRDRLAGVHPTLIAKVKQILDAMAAIGHPMIVTDTVRTEAEQVALYAKGRTAPGKIVTNCDGVTTPSPHQPKADGYGHAVDCAFDAPKPYDLAHPWNTYGVIAETLGLTWGGRWKMRDLPHVELR